MKVPRIAVLAILMGATILLPSGPTRADVRDAGSDAGAVAQQLDALRARTAADEDARDRLERELDGLRDAQARQARDLSIQGEHLDAGLVEERQRLGELTAGASRSAGRSRVAALVLLLGLLVEIVGALLLAGPALIAKHEDVLSLRGGPSLKDMKLEDKGAERSMNFLGSLGALFLTGGFVIQFLGTLVVLALGPFWSIAAALTAVAPASLLLWWLLGRSSEQTRREKLQVLWRNVRHNFSPVPWWQCACDYCDRPVSVTDEVRWREEENSATHPYLHQPRDWHVGHSKCLDESGWYRLARGVHGDPRKTRSASPSDFVRVKAPEYVDWWKRYHAHWAPQWGSANNPTAHEVEFTRTLKKVRRIVHGKE